MVIVSYSVFVDGGDDEDRDNDYNSDDDDGWITYTLARSP